MAKGKPAKKMVAKKASKKMSPKDMKGGKAAMMKRLSDQPM